jgi:hypothetical protein
MRKELLVFVPTTEHDNEISVTSVAKNRAYVLFNTGLGKFTAHRDDLIAALNAIDEFDKVNNTTATLVEVAQTTVDIEYGGE